MTIKEYNQAIDAYSDQLYRFACKTLNCHEDAQDVVQMSFETLWKEKDSVYTDKARSYLFTIVYRRCMDVFRVKKRVTNVEEFPVTAQHFSHHKYELKEYVQRALERLDTQSRTLVLLKDIEGYKYDEIAELTELSLEQVKVYLHRARKQLKKYLEPQKVNI